MQVMRALLKADGPPIPDRLVRDDLVGVKCDSVNRKIDCNFMATSLRADIKSLYISGSHIAVSAVVLVENTVPNGQAQMGILFTCLSVDVQ